MPSYSLPRKLRGELRLSLFFVQLNFFYERKERSNEYRSCFVASAIQLGSGGAY